MLAKLKKRKGRSRKSSRAIRSMKTQQGGKVNTNTLLIGFAIIILFVAGRDLLNALGARMGLFSVTTETKTVTVYRDRIVYAPTMIPTKKDIHKIDESLAEEGADPVSVMSKHRIPVPKPAPGRDVEQFGYIVRDVDKPLQNEDGTYNTKLLVQYDVKTIFGFRFNPLLAVGFDGKKFHPGVGSTFFQIHRVEASVQLTTKYAAIGGSYILRKETGLGVAYGLFFGQATPKVVVFAKVGI